MVHRGDQPIPSQRKRMLLSLFNLVLTVFKTVYRSWIFQTFWGWFVLLVFPSLPALPILATIGFFYMLGLCHKLTPLTRAEYDKMVAAWKKSSPKTTAEIIATKLEQRTSLLHAITDNCMALFIYTASLSGGYVVHYLIRRMG